MEERNDVQKALGRLTQREHYDRAFRLKRASHASVLHAPLPKEQWTKPQDVRVISFSFNHSMHSGCSLSRHARRRGRRRGCRANQVGHSCSH